MMELFSPIDTVEFLLPHLRNKIKIRTQDMALGSLMAILVIIAIVLTPNSFES